MKWDELSEQDCSVARALAVIGDRWTLMVLRNLFLGARRFEEIHESLGISRTTLTQRLALLESQGVIRKEAYQTRPARHEYRLTHKGIDLYPVLMTLVAWGDKHYPTENGPPIVHHHQPCGHDFTAVLACSECGDAVSPFETEPRAGQRFATRPNRSEHTG